jgi:nucleoside-diphosphate-sugar epimerase
LTARPSRGRPITVYYGEGQQSRCFCDVGDVARALEELATCEKAVGQVFYIGSDRVADTGPARFVNMDL